MRILFCGQSRYPNNSDASTNRYIAIAKTMAFENEIIFINRIPLLENNYFSRNIDFKVIDVSNHKFRPKNFIKRFFLKLFATLFEFRTIRKLNQEKKIDWINIYTQYFGLCLFYYFLSKIFNFKTIFHYVEIRSEFKNRNIFYKLNDFLCDNYVMFLFDRYIPISHCINQQIKVKNKKAKTLVIPPICDFNYFKTLNCATTVEDAYFLYCGSAHYTEVIVFIIESFKKIEDKKGIKLYLVLSGEITTQLKKLIEKDEDKIIIFSRLDYEKLICFYKNALALLIPLRNTKQDEARFPQKIGEYVASNKIIISTNYGEVKYYFKDMDNALIANDYDVVLYKEKMQWVILNRSKTKKLEDNAFESGRKNFDIASYYNPVKIFMT